MFNYEMDSETLDAIHAAEVLKEFCGYVRCEDCPFCSLGECSLMNEDCHFPADWNIPKVKTYKDDFLEQFPDASFESSILCRKIIYGGERDCREKTCQECWNEVYSESE